MEMEDLLESLGLDRTDEGLNLDEICRLCRTSRGVMSYIFSCTGVDTSTPLSERIMAFTNIKVSEGDGLPSLICHRCLYHIERVNEFKTLCLQSDALLRRYLSRQVKTGESKNNLKNDESQINPDYGFDSYMNVIQVGPTGESLNHSIKVEAPSENYGSNETSDNSREEDGKISCPFCFKDFLSLDQCNRHILIHSQEGPYPCDYCDIVEKDKVSLRAHWKEIHAEDRTMMCQTCGESYATKVELMQHKVIHEKSKPHQCELCGRAYAYRSDLRKHMLLHLGTQPFMCEVCCKTFNRLSTLNKHRRQHDGTAPFPCMDCDKIFGTRDDLKRHSSTHTGDKPYSCTICNISFNRRDKLMRHDKIHKMDRPHTCSECPTSFTRKEELTKHIQFYHYSNLVASEKPGGEMNATEDVVISIDPAHWAEQDFSDSAKSGHTSLSQSNDIPEYSSAMEERIFGCDYCVKRFKTKRELVRHVAIHTGYRPHRCHLCEKAFFRTDKLKRHILTHMKEKKPGRPKAAVKHECTECLKVLSSQNELRRHQMLHAAFRPFSCAYCNTSYCRRDKLVKHINRNHLTGVVNSSS